MPKWMDYKEFLIKLYYLNILHLSRKRRCIKSAFIRVHLRFRFSHLPLLPIFSLIPPGSVSIGSFRLVFG
ncbi:MAG: hypothetical protein PHH85_03810 [Candidatus Methanoperedens sp.]|nr:hypothetical protein [Candidatus Methanoperedens sp.]